MTEQAMAAPVSVMDTFRRTETKYVITANQAERLMDLAGPRLKEDLFFQYTVHNIYYDTWDSAMIIGCLEKPDYKEKLRLRSYGEPGENSPVFLEIKKKYQSITVKRRIMMNEADAYACMSGTEPFPQDSQIAAELESAVSVYHPQPKVFAAYDRVCWAGIEEEDLRITFDRNLRYRTDQLNLHLNGNEEQLLDPDTVLLEIKAKDRYPLWLVHNLTELGIRQGSFSKYGAIYQRETRKKLMNHRIYLQPSCRTGYAMSPERSISHV